MLPKIISAIKLESSTSRHITLFLALALAVTIGIAANLYYQGFNQSNSTSALQTQLASVSAQLKEIESQDQVKINQDLKKEITNIHDTFLKSSSLYENLVDLKLKLKNSQKLDQLFAQSLKLLSDKDYSTASKKLTELDTEIKKENAKLAPVVTTGGSTTSAPAPQSNTPPGSGYSRQSVQSDIGTFTVDIIAADLGSTKVIVDTASDSDCRDNCPVLSLGEYAARSGAYAGVNGSYFCPAAYPTCAGKANSYDTLVMNKNKVYINSDNNVYSTVPAAIFSPGSARFVGQSSDWGRDTGVDAVIANYPLLLSGGNITFGGNSDPKQGSKGSRSFIGTKGSQVYIGVVHNVTVAESAHVLKALGLSEALNLDSGGSTALWSGGYKVGPGRAIPNAVLFVRR